MIAGAGSATMFPSTNRQSCVPSSTAASDNTDSGSGCLPGVVDSGLKSTIIAQPRRQTPRALVAAAAAPPGGGAASQTDHATEKTAPANQERLPPAPDRETSEIRLRAASRL